MSLVELGTRLGFSLASILSASGEASSIPFEAVQQADQLSREHRIIQPLSRETSPGEFLSEANLFPLQLNLPPELPLETPPQTEPAVNPDLALVFLRPDANVDQLLAAVEKAGGHISQVYPGEALIGEIPENALVPDEENVARIHRGKIDPETINSLSPEQQHLVLAWNEFLVQPKPKTQAETPPAQDLVNDALIPPVSEPGQITTTDLPTSEETSVFMAKKVAVGIILPESNGSVDPSIEDWTPQERVSVLSENMAAFQWWGEREPKANFTFIVQEDGTQAPSATNWEPISRRYTDQALWIAQVMRDKGYFEPSYFNQVRHYDNDLRQAAGADWGVTIFVVDSSNDPDGQFLDGYFAYAYLGGPFMVMTYGNDGYHIGNMDAVAAHEIGHIFLALDQYYSAYQYCTSRSGYLGVANQNSQYGGCLLNQDSIMRSQVWPYTSGAVDPYARGQLGWQDSFERNPQTGSWEPGQDQVLDTAGSYYFSQIITSTQRLIATIDLQPLPLEHTAWNHVIHPNQIADAWLVNYLNQVIVSEQLIIQPGGQEAQVIFVVPPDQQNGLNLCVDGLFGGKFCRLITAKRPLIHLPIIKKAGTPSSR